MDNQLFLNIYLSCSSLLVLFLKLRVNNNGKINKLSLLVGLLIIVAIIFGLPKIGLTREGIGITGGILLYLLIPALYSCAQRFYPKWFQLHHKQLTWIFLATLLVMASVALNTPHP
jgi:hypothetical protein